MPTAYSYVRFSSGKQAKGSSEIRQTETPEAWCRRNGYSLDATLRLKDLGRSAYHGVNVSRGSLGVFLALIRDGMIPAGSALLIEHLDRLVRIPPMAALDVVKDIVAGGVDVVSLIDGERYTADRLGKDFACLLKLILILFQSHEQSDTKSYRIKRVWVGWREKARDGQRYTARRPAWIDAEGDLIPDKVAVLRRLFAMAKSGMGASRMAKVLNAEGVPTPDRAGRWSNSLIRYYLPNRLLIGEWQPCKLVDGEQVPEGDPIAGWYPAAIPETLFFEVQGILRSRKPLKGRVESHHNLFSGLVWSLMGGTYTYKESRDDRSGKAYRHASLVSRDRSDGVGPPRLNIRYDSFERAFLKLCSEEIDPVAVFKPTSDKAAELGETLGQIAGLDEKLAVIRDKVKHSKNIATLLDMIAEMDGERRTLLETAERLKGEINTSQVRVFEDLRALIADPVDRAKIAAHIRLLVERINVLAVHTGSAQHKRHRYYLYFEVWFHGGYIKHMLIEHDGKIPWSDFPYRRTVVGAASPSTIKARRRQVLEQVIPRASDRWLPVLREWLNRQ